MVRVETSVEIAAPPERVREVFLDFPKMPEWTNFFKSIEPLDGKQPMELVKDDKVKVDFGGMGMTAPILENSPERFQWVGSLPYIFTGAHSFIFEPSKTTPGHTTFTNMEDFTGLFSFTMASWITSGQRTQAGFQKFAEDLKRRCEGDSQERETAISA